MNIGGRVKANTVRDICSARKTEFKRTAAILRSQIDTQIMEAAAQGSGCVLVDVPKHYIGRDQYDWVQMGKAIVDVLLEDGYSVSGTYVRFRVVWEHQPVTQQRRPASVNKPLINIPLFKR